MTDLNKLYNSYVEELKEKGNLDTEIHVFMNCLFKLGMSFIFDTEERFHVVVFGGTESYSTGFQNGNKIDAFFDKNGMFLHMVQR